MQAERLLIGKALGRGSDDVDTRSHIRSDGSHCLPLVGALSAQARRQLYQRKLLWCVDVFYPRFYVARGYHNRICRIVL